MAFFYIKNTQGGYKLRVLKVTFVAKLRPAKRALDEEIINRVCTYFFLSHHG